MAKRLKFIAQQEAADCGPTCLKMIAEFHGKTVPLSYLRQNCGISRDGVSMKGIKNTAQLLGYRALAVKIIFDDLNDGAPLPCILHWNQDHFVILEEIKKKPWYKSKQRFKPSVIIVDPAHGKIELSVKDFMSSWGADYNNEGIVLLLEPGTSFTEENINGDINEERKGFKFLLKYLKNYKSSILQIFLGLIGVSIFQIIFPFLTQAIVDIGIRSKDIDFIVTILIAQIMLLIGQVAIEFIRAWLLFYITININISLISDFLTKLIKLPHSYFERKMTGDILQRISDHGRVQSFITQNSLSTIFSTVNFIIFSIILYIYYAKLFYVFILFSGIYLLWITFFLKKRKELDYKRFHAAGNNQTKMLQLIQGVNDIKLHNAENYRREEWENEQIKLFSIGLSGMKLQQIQEGGGFAINQFKNTILTFISAKAVIDGNMSLGMMMAIQYIIGQLNAPIQSFIGFIRAAQDAKISLDRIGEVYNEKDELQLQTDYDTQIPDNADVEFVNISFRYPGMETWVLENINLKIPHGKITAIVGSSGSGKTTLLKLLLKYFNTEKGSILIGSKNLNSLDPASWRDSIGAVMQEGYIFSDTIAGNVVVDGEAIDKKRLRASTEVAQIRDFIETLPLNYNTKIGSEGINMSMGQKQRLLIARAVYKNPSIIMFDEATNSLDSLNERKIVNNLNDFYKNKTVVIVAHRLSTVKNADNIIVLENGKIVEQGTHAFLVDQGQQYYNLVKNQLELAK